MIFIIPIYIILDRADNQIQRPSEKDDKKVGTRHVSSKYPVNCTKDAIQNNDAECVHESYSTEVTCGVNRNFVFDGPKSSFDNILDTGPLFLQKEV
jgi:hypothetical protein